MKVQIKKQPVNTGINDSTMTVNIGFLNTNIVNTLQDNGIKEAGSIKYGVTEKALIKAIKKDDIGIFIESIIRSYKTKNPNNRDLNKFLRKEFKQQLELLVIELKEMGYKFQI